jgi:radical SAM-linked protein
VETPIGEASMPAPAPVAEPRQRWRLTYARTPIEGDDGLVGHDYIALWERVLTSCGLPLVMTEGGRPKFAIAAPLPARMSARAELADIWLTRRLPAWRVRESLEAVLPAGHTIEGLEDIWLGGPALVGRVAAADYLVTLDGAPDDTTVVAAVDRVLASDRLARERTKGGVVKVFDLRPLIVAITVLGSGSSTALRLTTRIHPELGTGRPEEVVAAIASEAGVVLEANGIVRERLVLSDELGG